MTAMISTSTEYYGVEVEHRLGGETPVDPTNNSVYMAWQATRFPVPQQTFASSPWFACEWLTVTTPRGPKYIALGLIGNKNGGHPFAAGFWHVYLGVDGATEEPVKYVGVVRIQ
jgi:hypothetical protein